MKGRVFKRCTCPTRYDDAGKRLNCRKDHGSWSYTHDGPEAEGGKRKQVMRGGFTTATEAQDALTASLAALARGEYVETGRLAPTVGEYLADWLESKRDLRPGTRVTFSGHIEKHIVPLVGHVKLTKLRAQHIDRMMVAVREGDEKAGRKPVGVATSRRVFATLRSALNSAVKKKLLNYNPCAGVELEQEHRGRATAWNAEQARKFLAAAEGDRLAALFRLMLHRGLRRGEAIALRWSDVDLAARTVTVSQSASLVRGEVVIGRPKTAGSARVVSIGRDLVDALKAHRVGQNAERLAWAGAYDENNYVFAREDGTIERPDRVSGVFKAIASAAKLPAIRLHDTRHTAASLALESGASMKEVQDMLGHSTYALTADTYSHVQPEVRSESADRMEKYISGWGRQQP